MHTYTLTQAAKRLGRDKSRISRACQRLRLGRPGDGKSRLLTTLELRVLRAHFAAARPGNPSPRDEAGRFIGHKL